MKIFLTIMLLQGFFLSCSQCISKTQTNSSTNSKTDPDNTQKDVDGSIRKIQHLRFETLRPAATRSMAGTANEKSRVTIHYISRFAHNNVLMESTYQRLAPFSFAMGQGQVIQGWEEGILGMQVGEIRRIYIPSDKAFGKEGLKNLVSADQDFIYDIELVSID